MANYLNVIEEFKPAINNKIDGILLFNGKMKPEFGGSKISVSICYQPKERSIDLIQWHKVNGNMPVKTITNPDSNTNNLFIKDIINIVLHLKS